MLSKGIDFNAPGQVDNQRVALQICGGTLPIAIQPRRLLSALNFNEPWQVDMQQGPLQISTASMPLQFQQISTGTTSEFATTQLHSTKCLQMQAFSSPLSLCDGLPLSAWCQCVDSEAQHHDGASREVNVTMMFHSTAAVHALAQRKKHCYGPGAPNSKLRRRRALGLQNEHFDSEQGRFRDSLRITGTQLYSLTARGAISRMAPASLAR